MICYLSIDLYDLYENEYQNTINDHVTQNLTNKKLN